MAGRLRTMTGVIALAAAFALAGCAADTANSSGGDASASPAAGTTLQVIDPSSGGSVTVPFTVKLQSAVPLGEPGTGRKHVHIWFDGQESAYTMGFSDQVEITKLAPGQHTMTVSLRNADHSAVSPKVEATGTTIMVTGAGVSPTGPEPSGSSMGEDDGKYDY